MAGVTKEPGGVSVAAVIVSSVFAVLLITAPERLDTAWQWIRDLPIVIEVIAWGVLLAWRAASGPARTTAEAILQPLDIVAQGGVSS